MKQFMCVMMIVSMSKSIQAQSKFGFTIESSVKIDSVTFFNFGQNHFFKVPYKDTLSFSFNADITDLYTVWYHTGEKTFQTQIWLDSGHVQVSGRIAGNTLNIDTVISSPIYYHHQQFQQAYVRLLTSKDTLALNTLYLESFNQNNNNAYSLRVAELYVDLNKNKKKNLMVFNTMLRQLPPSVTSHIFYKFLTREITGIIGTTKLDFSRYTFISRGNELEKIKPAAPKYLVVDLWFTACPPCVEDHARISKNLKKLKDNNVELLGISIDASYSDWNSYLTKHGYTWMNYKMGDSRDFVNDLGVSVYPTYYIVNEKLEIIAIYNSFAQVSEHLEL